MWAAIGPWAAHRSLLDLPEAEPRGEGVLVVEQNKPRVILVSPSRTHMFEEQWLEFIENEEADGETASFLYSLEGNCGPLRRL